MRRRDRVWLHALLFLATVLTTSLVGYDVYATWLTDFGREALAPDTGAWDLWIGGLWYSLAALGILTAHEFGHYLTCRYYGIDASLPYFLPMISLVGTLGAVIRIRQPITSKRILFDVGVAGPIGGFIVAVPVLWLGMSWSKVTTAPSDPGLLTLGTPLLFDLAAWLSLSPLEPGQSLNIHPLVFGAWFGLLATALNLLPIGQLDGGHISYAVFGSASTAVTLLALAAALALGFLYSPIWFFWAALFSVMLLVFGLRHPRTLDEDVPLDPRRRWIALGALLMFVLCFTPTPISPADLVRP